MPENSIKLDARVEDVYVYGVPLVIQPVEHQNDLAELIDEGPIVLGPDGSLSEVASEPIVQALRKEVVNTGRSIRDGGDPRTVLAALILADRLSLGQIAGMIHQDPRDLDDSLRALIAVGWVDVTSENHLPKYTLIGLDRT
jgi:hypothetical protein